MERWLVGLLVDWIVVPLAFLAVGVYLVVRRGLQVRQIAEDGAEVTAHVVRKWKFRSPWYMICYEYKDDCLQLRMVSDEDWRSI